MSRRQIALLSLVVLLGLAVAWVALRERQPPLLPADEEHARFAGAAACMTCHAAQGPAPQGRNHPLGNDCLRCHGLP